MNHHPKRQPRALTAWQLLSLLVCSCALLPFQVTVFAHGASGAQPAESQARYPATPRQTESQPGQFYGLYRGIVVSRPDPHMRVQVEIPALNISGEWALPCVPVGSSAVPPLRSQVWIMFEQGNTHFPVWMGVLP